MKMMLCERSHLSTSILKNLRVKRDLRIIYPVSVLKQKSLQNMHVRPLSGGFLPATRGMNSLIFDTIYLITPP